MEKGYKVVGTVRSYRYANNKNFEYLGIEKQVILEELDLLDMANVIRIIRISDDYQRADGFISSREKESESISTLKAISALSRVYNIEKAKENKFLLRMYIMLTK